MKDIKMRIILPENRYMTGSLKITDGDKIISGPYRALGKADNAKAAAEGNPDRDPTLEYGDTPSGEYSVIIEKPQAYFGDSAFFRLEPESGDALIAKENGRDGLLVHGGTPRLDGSLKATHGCIRLKNEDIDKVIEDLQKASYDSEKLICNMLNLKLGVQDAANSSLKVELDNDNSLIENGLTSKSAPTPEPINNFNVDNLAQKDSQTFTTEINDAENFEGADSCGPSDRGIEKNEGTGIETEPDISGAGIDTKPDESGGDFGGEISGDVSDHI